MTTPTERTVRPLSLVILIVLAVLPAPRDAAADPFSLSKVTVGGGTFSDGGPFDLVTKAEVTAGAGHVASAYTDQLTRLTNQGLSAGARAGTSGEEQSARAEAPSWTPGSARTARSSATSRRWRPHLVGRHPRPAHRLADRRRRRHRSSSLSAFFSYTFPYGTFSFQACYEPGNAFDRAESGCATPLEATLDKSDGTHVDLTNAIVLGVNALGQTTVAFDFGLGWLVRMDPGTTR
jgi:hypothetical protein